MSLKNKWLLNIIMVLLSWFLLPLLGTRNIKRYLPATILVLIIQLLDTLYGKQRRWWILKWTFGNFKRFILLYVGINALFAYPIINLLEKLKIVTLGRFNNLQFFPIYFIRQFY